MKLEKSLSFRAKKGSGESRGVGAPEEMANPELLRLREKFGATYIKQAIALNTLGRMSLQEKLFPLVTTFLESTSSKPHGLSVEQLDAVETVLLYLESTEKS